ncbi:MAG: transpeptidase family protein [Candidatus Glassbacteria bacterium]|nr:transpeptidase family protein [Candidatus Glassbacteria bacterium]
MARTRLSLVFWCLVLLAGLISGHLFRIQVLQREHYLAEADRQHKQKIILRPRRGDILDVSGEPLAVSAEGLDVYAVPSRITDRRKTASALATHLDLPGDNIMKRIGRQRPFVMIQQKVSPLKVRELRRMNLPGIGFVPSSKRYYPHHALAAQLIGYVGVDEVGLTGIEFALDQQLRGAPGWLVVQRDARGKPYNMLDYPLEQQSNGCSVRLTIEADFQEIVEEALRRSVTTSGAKNGCVVAVRPSTGEILAMASYPSIDLNVTRSFGDGDFRNLATNLPFEPGSTFKPFVACALISGGHVSFDDSVFCENGTWRLGRRTIRDVHQYGRLSFAEVLAKSSNIGMAKLVQSAGDNELYRALRSFGFGNYTGSEFSGEDRGRLLQPDRWDRTTKTSLAIGYGLLVTPLQMAMGYAALANGGKLYEPTVIAAITDEHGNVCHSSKPREVRQAVDPEIAKLVCRAMVRAVDNGTGTTAKVHGFPVAGKTGTSMKADPGTGYGGNGYISSFGGFFPADDPQLAIFVMINEPSFSFRWGSASAAPVFGEIIRNTMLSASSVIDRSRLDLPDHHLMAVGDNNSSVSPSSSGTGSAPLSSVQPDRPDPSSMPDVRGMPVRKAVATLTSLGLKVKVDGTVKVISQDLPPASRIVEGQTILLVAMPAAETGGRKTFSMAGEPAKGSAVNPQRKQGDAN